MTAKPPLEKRGGVKRRLVRAEKFSGDGSKVNSGEGGDCGRDEDLWST